MAGNRLKNFIFLAAILLTSTQSKVDYIDDDTEEEEEEQRLAIFSFDFRGLGFNIFNMLRHKIYYADLGRDFAVNDLSDRYRYEGQSVIQKFFSPQFPFLEGTNANSLMVQKYTPPEHEEKHATVLIKPLSRSHLIVDKYDGEVEDGYEWLCDEACKHFKFNRDAKKLMRTLKKEHDIPDIANYVSVTFHIPRSIKILNESEKYNVEEYIKKLSGLKIRRKIQYCFVATDDYDVVEEMKLALKNADFDCRVYTLAKKSQDIEDDNDDENDDEELTTKNKILSQKKSTLNHGDDEILLLMTELSIMVDSTFFIGSFNSNIGGLAAVLRGCVKRHRNNRSNSYGVDKEDFDWIS